MMTEAEQKKAGTLSLPVLRQQALTLHRRVYVRGRFKIRGEVL